MLPESEHGSLDLEKSVLELIKVKQRRDQLLEEAQQMQQKLAQKYAPRARFERWRDSNEGQLWKRAQYKRQKGCCASCQTSILLSGSHIDHIEHLARSPH